MKKSKEYRKKKGITFSSITNGQGGSLKLAYKGKGMVDIDTIMEEYAEYYHKQKLAEEKQNVLQEILIKPDCRKLHGTGGAFDVATKKLIATYIMFAANNQDRTFKLQLVIETKTQEEE